jgi:hypothetical protein
LDESSRIVKAAAASTFNHLALTVSSFHYIVIIRIFSEQVGVRDWEKAV